MKKLKTISLVKNIKTHEIDGFIKFLNEEKEKGATVLTFLPSRWIQTSKVMTIEDKPTKVICLPARVLSIPAERILDI